MILNCIHLNQINVIRFSEKIYGNEYDKKANGSRCILTTVYVIIIIENA